MTSFSESDISQWSTFFDDDIHFAAAVLAEAGFYGMYIILFCISVYTVLRGGGRSAGTIIQFSAFCAMFALSTGLLGMDIADLVVCLQTDRANFSASPSAERQMEAWVNARDKLIFYAKPLFELEFLIGDALIVWRVLVLYKSQRFAFALKLVLGALWLSALVLASRETACWVQSVTLPSDPPLCTALRQAAWGVSLSLNALASIFVWRVIRERRAMLRSMAAFTGQNGGKTRVDRVLYILLVSSTVYIAFGLLAVFLTLHAGRVSVDGLKEMAYIATLVSDQIVGIYPSVVTIFVLNQETIFGPLSSSPTFVRNETTTSIRFNPDVSWRSAPRAQRITGHAAISDEEAAEPGTATLPAVRAET